MNFTFKLNGVTYTYDIESECSIDPLNLQDELAKHSSKVAFVSAVTASFKSQLEKKKVELSELGAKLDLEIRRQAQETGEKVTEKFIESLITNNKVYSDLKKEYLDILDKFEMANAWMEAMKHRQFTLVSLVQLSRAENQNAPIVCQ